MKFNIQSLKYSQIQIYRQLISIYGINKATALKFCAYIGVQPITLLKDIDMEKKLKLISIIQKNYIIDDTLKYIKDQNIKNKIIVNSNIGIRHKNRLPTKNQRTRTNAQTAKKLSKNFKFN